MKNDVDANEIANMGRRKTLMSAATGATVLSAWQAPVIRSIVLPAHAAMSLADEMDEVEEVEEVDEIEEEDQNTPDVDFFATSATATVTQTMNGSIIFDSLIPIAHAQSIISEPVFENPSDLIFEAEAISTGNSTYDIQIAAQILESNERVANPTYLYGWSGSITGLDNPTLLSKTGCADDEMVTITAISGSELTLKMDYFTEELTLDLEPGTITMPTFPFVCSNNS